MKKRIHFLIMFFSLTCSALAQQKLLDSLFAVGAFSAVLAETNECSDMAQNEAFLRANALQNLGRNKEALAVYSQYLEEPFNPKYIFPYAKLLITYGKNEKADELFSKLIQTDTTNGEYYYQRAKLRKTRFPDLFMHDLEVGYQQQPNHLKLANLYSRELIAAKQYHMAEKVGNEVLYLDATNPGMHSNMGQLCFKQKKYAKAAYHFEEILALPDTPLFVYRKLGEAYTIMKKYDKALEIFELLLAKNPEDHYLMVEMAELYALQANTVRALELNNLAYAMKDVSRDKQNYTYGFIFQQKKDFKKAMAFYEDCLSENSLHEKALFARATCADQLGYDASTRINYYQAYLKHFPSKGQYSSTAKIRIRKLKQDAFMGN